MPKPVNIRNATAHDLRSIMKLERSCPTAAHWSEQQYSDAIARIEQTTERLLLIADADREEDRSRSSLIGFLVARHASQEWELENIMVAAQERQKGIGAALLAALLDRMRQSGSKQILLEVRESNAPARKLYEKAGFRATGRRKLYYSNPPEDAILYSHDVV